MRVSLRTNEDRLVEIGVLGEVAPARMGASPYRIGPDGEAVILPSTGGITYNIRIGDPAVGWAADHVEPGVTVQSREREGSRNANAALNVLACIGNRALVVNGNAKGGRGVVTGKHGGVDHVLVDFPASVLDDLAIGDRIQIRTRGLGLILTDHPEVKIFNLDPGLLGKMGLEVRGERVVVPVAAVIPSEAMGSGVGAPHCFAGDYDLQTADREALQARGLDRLRLGDVVALMDSDHRFGRSTRKGALAIGVVVHTDCVVPGHGPGVTTLMSSAGEFLGFDLRPSANIADYLRAGRARREKPAPGAGARR